MTESDLVGGVLAHRTSSEGKQVLAAREPHPLLLSLYLWQLRLNLLNLLTACEIGIGRSSLVIEKNRKLQTSAICRCDRPQFAGAGCVYSLCQPFCCSIRAVMHRRIRPRRI